MGDVTRFVLGVDISNCRLFRRILWTARTLHKASEAISLVSNPSISNVLIKLYCAASSCGAMITADTKALTLVRLENEEGGWEGRWHGRTATSVWKWTPLKIIN